MKMHIIVVSMLLAALPGWAQNPPAGMPSKADMQKMMQQAQSMSKCMAGIDQSRLEALSKEAQQISNEIEGFCAKGAEQDALDAAMEFSRKLQNDPTVQQMRTCSAGIEKMMPGFLPDFSGLTDVAEAADEGICSD